MATQKLTGALGGGSESLTFQKHSNYMILLCFSEL